MAGLDPNFFTPVVSAFSDSDSEDFTYHGSKKGGAFLTLLASTDEIRRYEKPPELPNDAKGIELRMPNVTLSSEKSFYKVRESAQNAH